MATYHIKFIETLNDENDHSETVYRSSSSAWLVTPGEPWRRPSGGLNVSKINTLALASRSYEN